MENYSCTDCRHYVHHYAIADERMVDVWCGVCVLGRPKHRKPDQKACDAFEEAQRKVPGREELKILLLQYLLDLEKQKGRNKEPLIKNNVK